MDEDICDPLSRTKVIDLHKSGGALSVSPGSKFYTWYNRTGDWQCKFTVRAPKDASLFASIQSISFRKIGNECLDYVRVNIIILSLFAIFLQSTKIFFFKLLTV